MKFQKPKCFRCRSQYIRWENPKGLSGWTCPNHCAAEWTIDEFPYDLRTLRIKFKLINDGVINKYTNERDLMKVLIKLGLY